MSDVVKYINAKGDEVNFSTPPLFASTIALREFMSKFKNGKTAEATDESIDLLVVMLCNNTEKNKIFDVLDYDASTGQLGKLYINDWFLPCSFMGIKKIEHDDATSFKGELEFVAPKMEFLKETTYHLYPNVGGGTGLNFPYNFPFNYSAQKTSIVKIINATATDADFVFQFTGEAPYVEFAVGDINYVVNSQMLSGESFKIDTLNKTVYKSKDGVVVDLFGLADDSTYIFKQIPPGPHPLSWIGDFAVDFTLIEHRRYPEWI